jgi:Replicase family/Primase C terminal 1 (PriCT-1)
MNPASTITRDTFAAFIPARPYSTEDLSWGLRIRKRERALGLPYIQPNYAHRTRFLAFDEDHGNALMAHADANVAVPNFIVFNRDTGRGKICYLFGEPVHTADASRIEPLKWLAQIRRGYVRRLRCDPGYSNLIIQNPLHPRWATVWLRGKPYTLAEMDRWLEFADKAPLPRPKLETGCGRNSVVFDELRRLAPKQWRASNSVGGLNARLAELADRINHQFREPLPAKEVAAIAKSCARWHWRRFTEEGFSRRQSWASAAPARVHRKAVAAMPDAAVISTAELADRLCLSERQARRYKPSLPDGPTSPTPWLALGISRRTFYRRKALGL